MSRFLDGIDDGLTSASAPALDAIYTSGEFTAGLWVRPETVANPRTIMRFGESGSQPFVGFGIAINSSGNIEGQIAISGPVIHSIQSTTAVTHDVWQLYTLRIRDSDNMRRIWLNGSQIFSDSATAFSLFNMTDARFAIGVSQQWGERFKGQVAHAFVYDSFLTDTQIGELYNGGSGGNGKNPLNVQATDLIGYWPLAGTSSPEPDDSVNSTTLTVTGAVAGGSNPSVDPPPGGTVVLTNVSSTEDALAITRKKIVRL